MSELFHTIRCIVQMPDYADDIQTVIEVPGGMAPGETLRFWANLEDEYKAVHIEIVEEKDKRLWWST